MNEYVQWAAYGFMAYAGWSLAKLLHLAGKILYVAYRLGQEKRKAS